MCPFCDHDDASHGPYGCTAERGWPARHCECAVTDVPTAIAEFDMVPAVPQRRAA